MTPQQAFTEDELTELLEIARVALNNKEMLEQIADEIDMADWYMKKLTRKLNGYMKGEA